MVKFWADQQNVTRTGAPIQHVALHGQRGQIFLGAHQRRDGVLEIIFERVGRVRSVWHVRSGSTSLDGLQAACLRAVVAQDPLGTLYSALEVNRVRLECVEERFLGYDR